MEMEVIKRRRKKLDKCSVLLDIFLTLSPSRHSW